MPTGLAATSTERNIMDLKWTVASFEELDNHALYAIMRLRQAVFVVEQDCAYQDLDDHDANNPMSLLRKAYGI